MLQITNLSKKYANSDTYAVQDVSFEVKEGEVFGFLGPNGAGKSTTIKCITGILPFERGSIALDGHNLQEDPIAVKLNIGYVSDNHMMYDKLTAREYVNFMADIYKVGVNDRKSRTDKLLEMFELGDVFDKSISTFSHGMKQKVCVIGALVHKPKLWVLDEPLTGLDPKSAFILKEMMKEHAKEGNSVFFSSHMLEVVEKVCDKIAIVDKGKLLLVSDMDKLQDNASQLSLEEFFLSVTNSDAQPDVEFD
ncbi:MAG: ABC transporter ATP-binding protein [Christensenellales bacterium]